MTELLVCYFDGVRLKNTAFSDQGDSRRFRDENFEEEEVICLLNILFIDLLKS